MLTFFWITSSKRANDLNFSMRCERKRKAVNYRPAEKKCVGKTLEIADLVEMKNNVLIFAAYSIWTAHTERATLKKKSIWKRKSLISLWKRMRKLDDERRWVEVYTKWNESIFRNQPKTKKETRNETKRNDISLHGTLFMTKHMNYKTWNR